MNTTYINKPDILKWCIYKILLIMRLTTVILMVSMLQVSASTVAQEFTYVKKGASLTLADFFSSIDVRGKVVDENNQPLAGAVVKVKGTKQAILTNKDGEFILNDVNETSILVISHLGYEPQEIAASKNIGTIKLNLRTDKLEEVEINAGYYIVKDRERTGSISKVTAEQIAKQPVNNVLESMQANVPGLEIIQNTGVPGGGFTVRVRGQNSISQGSEPFYIIDGVPYPVAPMDGSRSLEITPNANTLASINPSDIESIEVLKDADATAIYGSRGANGVILITTKKGRRGKAVATMTANHGISRVAKRIDLLNTQQYLEMRNQAFTNDQLTPGATDYDVNGTWDKNRYTDWQKELIGGIAPTTNLVGSLSGGTNNLTFLIGGNYYKEDTVFPGESTYGRNSGNFNLQYTSDSKRFSTSVDANYSQINSSLIPTDLTRFILLAPNYPALLGENETINWENNTMVDNPMAITRQLYNSKTNNLVANAMVSYAIIPNLKVKANLGYNRIDRNELSKFPLTTISPIAYNYSPASRRSYFTNNSNDTWILEAQVDWSKIVGAGKFNVLLGTTLQESLNVGQEVKGSNYSSDVLLGNISAASILAAQNSRHQQYRYNAIYGRLNYNLKDKYFFNATGRRDGSSRFGTDKRFANFGALGAAWLISNEVFLKENIPFIDLLKLRGSYGITGNDKINDYAYLELWSNPFNGNYQGMATLTPKQLANPSYAWEKNRKSEIALDLAILGNRVAFSSGYYNNRSSNQLLGVNLAPSTGFTTITDNLPAVVANTGWEFEIRTKNVSSQNFNWTTSVNLTIPNNKLVSYPNLATSAQANTFSIGHPLNIRRLFNTYVDPQTGFYVQEDYDRNGSINEFDQYVIKFVGRKYFGGLQNSFSFKRVQLDLLFQFVKQSGSSEQVNFNAPGSGYFTDAGTFNQLTSVFSGWQSPGDNLRYQKFSTGFDALLGNIYATGSGTQAISDCSFIRLKNVSFSYGLPFKLIEKLSMQNAKLFLQGQNLLTFTKYKGLDPETQSIINLPSLQIFTAGVQITF